MKQLFILCIALLTLSPQAFADGKKKKAPKEAVTVAPPLNDSEVHWLSINEAQAAMKKEPRKVWIDIYTGWCGWCKVMDKKTFANPNVAKYLNAHFYAIRFDAEQKDSVTYLGKKYGFVPEQRANQLAIELMQGAMSYPTSVYLEPEFKSVMPPIPNYLDVPTMELILKYLGEDKYKTIPFDQWQKEFKPEWL